jgi:hypothetical protein
MLQDSANAERGLGPSEPELIRHFHEKLPAVVDIAFGGVEHSHMRNYIQVLQIGVIPHIHGRARMHQICKQEIGIKLP